MQVSVENTSALERRMSVTVPAERIESQVNKLSLIHISEPTRPY